MNSLGVVVRVRVESRKGAHAGFQVGGEALDLERTDLVTDGT